MFWFERADAVIRCVACILLAALCSVSQEPSKGAPRADNSHIAPGARVFLESMDGFEDYLAAAFHAKQVPVVVVTDKDKADFLVTGSASNNEDQHHTRAAIKIVSKEGVIVFAYAFDDDYAIHGKQSAAEACAKNLKKEVLGH